MNCQLHDIDDDWIHRAEKEVKEDRKKIESKLEEFRTLIKGKYSIIELFYYKYTPIYLYYLL